MSETQANQVPLAELMRRFPREHRWEQEIQWHEDGTCTGHRLWPVGRYMHEAADRIEELERELAEALSARERAERERDNAVQSACALREELSHTVPSSRYWACNTDWLREKDRADMLARNGTEAIETLRRDVDAATKRALAAESRLAEAKREGYVRDAEGPVRGYIAIDHGRISLGCKPETIQLFVDRMVAAKVERALAGGHDGYVLVPESPTPEMLDEGYAVYQKFEGQPTPPAPNEPLQVEFADIYRAMLSAAPREEHSADSASTLADTKGETDE